MNGFGSLARRIAAWLVAVVIAMNCSSSYAQISYTHPLPPPQASDFRLHPPPLSNALWHGPRIKEFNVRCWHAETGAPANAVGGSNEFQQVTTFISLDSIDRIDRNFQQTSGTFSGGGRESKIAASDIPPGVFVTFKGHPVFSVTRIRLFARAPFPWSAMGKKPGVLIDAEFLQAKGMGECYLYGAVWVSRMSS